MMKQFLRGLLLSPTIWAAALLSASAQTAEAVAQSRVAQFQKVQPSTDMTDRTSATWLASNPLSLSNAEGIEMGETAGAFDQVTSVSQLTDVRPTDWAFQALQSLVERYGCIVGYPDRTYRGNQALTRYEFAAGLNACLDRVNELIAAGTADLVKKEDLAILQKLQEEFAAELATLRGRVDGLEARTTTLERQQFSTTTKLNAEAVFALTAIATGQNALGQDIDNIPIVGDRIRLNFDTSFNGRDLLRTRLQAINLPSFSDTTTLTPEGSLRFAGDDTNRVEIDALLYQFPISERTTVTIEANAGATDDFADTLNAFIDGDGGTGAFSNFATRNSIYYYADGNAGIGIRHEFNDNLELSLGYLAGDPANPAPGAGLFNGPYGAIAQVVVKPSERFKIGLTYVHSYNTEPGTGSNFANPRSFLQRTFDVVGGEVVDIPAGVVAALPAGGTATVQDLFSSLGFTTDIPVVNNAYGLGLSWQLNDNFVLNGWVGYTQTRTLSSGGGLFTRGNINSLNWAVSLAFPDLLKKGGLGGLIVGMEPKVVSGNININPGLAPLAALIPGDLTGAFGENDATSLHVEAFYQYPITENIAITPGLIWLTAPDHNSRNNDIVIGVIRTTFSF